jgi:hypothetical protein
MAMRLAFLNISHGAFGFADPRRAAQTLDAYEVEVASVARALTSIVFPVPGRP